MDIKYIKICVIADSKGDFSIEAGKVYKTVHISDTFLSVDVDGVLLAYPVWYFKDLDIHRNEIINEILT